MPGENRNKNMARIQLMHISLKKHIARKRFLFVIIFLLYKEVIKYNIVSKGRVSTKMSHFSDT